MIRSPLAGFDSLDDRYGRFVRRFAQEKLNNTLKASDYQVFIEKLLAALENKAGYLTSHEAKNREGKPTRLYQLKLTEIIWKPKRQSS